MLFLDDNEQNLNEALYYSKDLMTAMPTEIPKLLSYFKSLDRNDLELKRLNQLNYTKIRDDKNTILQYITSDDYRSGYVTVKDKYGDYGMVGFFCIRKNDNHAIHLLFSCRTIGQGICIYKAKEWGRLTVSRKGKIFKLAQKIYRSLKKQTS